MIRTAHRAVALGLAVLLLAAAPLRAGGDFDRLWSALGLGDLIGVMQDEGLGQTEALAYDYLSFPPGEAWAALSRRIYDRDRMEQAMRLSFAEALGEAPVDDLVDFFESPLGRRIVTAELEMRKEFLDPAVEEEARRRAATATPDTGRIGLIDDYIAVNDLIEFNVMGALNSNYHFYLGMAEGGALEMTEEDMVTHVWSQEEMTRADTSNWLRAFLLAAYDPLSDEELREYIKLSGTDEGQRLNRALFLGFERMYDDIYHALGLAVADQMDTQEL
ncbi:hypothetical protein ATO6_17225 [Oceanicola sp. 22II-s10i]|uniref:DUF2059 domain-containing protein n=1 Tax=Oceanicola sp. 22II-s10i TaxID=1317116 RepID=UPI000B5202DF|nr:DUF2059 domain-containing protein [Oceanicola sp. 22II-s10i]OWU83611.1 hypothetical protein ATO6_17225 [Oceanicola sp. 22II-s10i]